MRIEPLYGYPAITDIDTAVVRGFAVLGATFLLFFALKSRKENLNNAYIAQQAAENSNAKVTNALDDEDKEDTDEYSKKEDEIENDKVSKCILIKRAKSRQLSIKTIKSQLKNLETVFYSDKFAVDVRRCNECGQLYIYCYREYTGNDAKYTWMFWIPTEATEIDKVKNSDTLMKSMGELVSRRSHIFGRNKGETLVWSKRFYLATRKEGRR